MESCEEIVQSTPSSGLLEFDVILHQFPYSETICSHLTISVAWPEDWDYELIEPCGDEGSSFSRWENTADIYVKGDIPMDEELVALARVMLRVRSPGALRVTSVSGCNHPIEHSALARAQLACGNCYWPCNHSWYVGPSWDPDVLELSVEAGLQASDTIRVDSGYCVEGGELLLSASEPWMTVGFEDTDRGQHNVTVIADSQGLDPGTYEGWVTAEQNCCYECALVRLTVLEGTPPAVEKTTWGRIKHRFR